MTACSVGLPFTNGSSEQSVTNSELDRFFAEITHKVDLTEIKQRRNNRKEASDFNVFTLIEPDENKLSDILHDLLDPNGSHGQGDLFLQLLFKQLGLDTPAQLTKGATVQREAITHGIHKYQRRMDVFVEAGVLLAIENKVGAPEQENQVKDYLDHLRYCTRQSEKKSFLIYLTPDGRPPKSTGTTSYAELRCWSYTKELSVWLEACIQQCTARRIQVFLRDFIEYNETEIRRILHDGKNNES